MQVRRGGGGVARCEVLDRDVCGRRVLRVRRVVWPCAVGLVCWQCLVCGSRAREWPWQAMPAIRGAAGAARWVVMLRGMCEC